MKDNDEIDIAGLTFKRVYDYQPYSYWRICEILKEHYNAYLDEILVGYKGKRIAGYKNKYRILDITTNEILVEKVYLDNLRHLFANLDYPLKKPDIPVRNKKAEEFMNIIKSLSNE